MSAPKATRWFSAKNEKPVRSGVYQIKCRHSFYKRDTFMLFNDDRWLWPDGDDSSFGQPCDQWRGLVSTAGPIEGEGV